MVIVHSLDLDYSIWLGMTNRSMHQDPDASTESYRGEVDWWRPSCSLEDIKELYKNCLNKNQIGSLVNNEICLLMLIASFGHGHRRKDGWERKLE